ncbi:Argonaute/Dicer protein, PAZ [Artemisia annua]|uniref:Argonaute/Dicer protein, PAZ n=1 Tax=Artemisia annua TaxID=35608 RepID=A0A2U1NFA4_ARTAN|nr:Argonaute/Dicer protein, PAZ [Artemisia annua]
MCLITHGSPRRSDVPSIAVVVSSRHWPLISCYRAYARAQSARVEMIDGLLEKDHRFEVLSPLSISSSTSYPDNAGYGYQGDLHPAYGAPTVQPSYSQPTPS